MTVIDTNDFIDLFHTITNYIKDTNMNLLDNKDSNTCSEFIELCYKHLNNKINKKYERYNNDEESHDINDTIDTNDTNIIDEINNNP